MSECTCDLEHELREVHMRMHKGLDEISAIRAHRSIETAGKWAEKIKSVTQEFAKANAIVATGRCSIQQNVEHFKLVAQTVAVLQATGEGYRDSLESGGWAIVLACEEFRRRWGSPRP